MMAMACHATRSAPAAKAQLLSVKAAEVSCDCVRINSVSEHHRFVGMALCAYPCNIIWVRRRALVFAAEYVMVAMTISANRRLIAARQNTPCMFASAVLLKLAAMAFNARN